MKMGSTIRRLSTTVCCWACMLDIIWNAVEDEYLTVIMYLLCSIPMKFSGKTSQMIHNCRPKIGSRSDQATTGGVPTRSSQVGTLSNQNAHHSRQRGAC